MSNQALAQLIASLKVAVDRKRYRSIDFFVPYPKQEEFFETGTTKRERLFRAGNQLGKTYAGAAEMDYHLTGQYPVGWKGRRFTKPIRAWACGEGGLLTRDGPQKLLCGTPGVGDDFGTGFIPRAEFADKPSMSRGVTDAYDTIQVKHYTNGVYDGISTLTFKSYDQGRTKFQTDTVDVIWADEEPPADIYGEMLARITATRGMIFITFTPLKGMSTVVARFLSEISEDRSDTVMTIYDAKHIPPDERAKIIAGYPAHERDARTMGVPMQGEGRIFPVEDALISEPTWAMDQIPSFWSKIWGIDFGIGHPFACALQAWDRDNDVIHVLHAARLKDGLPINHAAMMKPIGAAVRVAWPKDGSDREKSTGKSLSLSYTQQGLLMLPEPATWPDGGVSTEQGVTEMHERMITGRYKVAEHLLKGDWGNEFRNYHRKDGQIVKIADDLMSASRIAVMAKRFGTTAPLGRLGRKPGVPREIAEGVDFNPFTG